VASQVTNILHQITATSTQINQADYGYNTVGNRTSLTDRRGIQSFGYDSLDRLTSASHPFLRTPQAFAYDAVGNRTTGGSVVNAGNQLTADAQFTYQYDDNGNQTRKTSLATGNYTQYTYDAENRLTKVEDFAAGNPTPAFTSTYRYDGLGRRIEKVANGQTKRYIYDGEDILLEYDGSNVLQAWYTHGSGIDEPIAVTKGSATFFYHADGLGTVTELTDSAGTMARAYAYDAYGNILESPGTVEQPYTYTGREFDSESGLYYYRNRYFDSQAGRFLTRDPLGISRSPNVYNYVFNNPLNLTDPTGLAGGRGATPSHGSSLGSGWGGVQNWVDGFNWRRQQWQGGRDHWQAIRDRCAELRKNIDDLRGSCPKDPQSQDLLKQLEEILNWCDQNFPPGAPMPSPVPAPSGAGGGRSNEPSIAPAQAVLGAAAAVAVACALVPEVCIPAGATAAAIAAGIITIPH
jgi:RHS repeat-associated protein